MEAQEQIAEKNAQYMPQPDLEEVHIESTPLGDEYLPTYVTIMPKVKIKDNLVLDIGIYDDEGVLGETDGFSAVMMTSISQNYLGRRVLTIKNGKGIETQESADYFQEKTSFNITVEFSEEEVGRIKQAFQKVPGNSR